MSVPKLRFKREDGAEFPDWESTSFGKTCTGFEYGMNSASTQFDGENKYIRITDIGENSHRYLNDNIVSPLGKKDDKYIVKSGNILLARTGASVGKSYLYNENDGKLYYAGFLIRMSVKDCYVPYFIFLQTLTETYKKWITVTSMRTGQQGVNAKEYSGFSFKIPCFEEQQKIADFLSNVDEVILQSEAEVKNLEKQKKGAMQKIFSQEVRFRRDDGAEFPKWEDCILSDYCKELKTTIEPKKRPNDSFLEYSMSAFDLDKKPSKVFGNDMNSSRKVINTCCVLINKLNVRKKRIWKVINPENNSVCSAEFIPVTSDAISLDFLEHLALSERFTSILLECSTGTSNSQKRVTPNIIMDMPISIPCLEEQRKIAAFLSAYDEAITYAKQELEHWKQLKKGLLQQMFI